jgi:hypothetical protein
MPDFAAQKYFATLLNILNYKKRSGVDFESGHIFLHTRCIEKICSRFPWPAFNSTLPPGKHDDFFGFRWMLKYCGLSSQDAQKGLKAKAASERKGQAYLHRRW